MPQNKPWLIISESGRALAVSAARAGLGTIVIDQFADIDTRATAQQVRQVSGSGSGFDPAELINVLSDFAEVDFAGVVIGSGLEAQSEILDHISMRWPVYGNAAETVRCCKDPYLFFRALQELRIAYPQTLTDELPECGNWLLKGRGLAGGQHIHRYRPGSAIPEGYYLQEEITGRTVSAVFIADGTRAMIVGVNEIYAAAQDGGDFRYLAAVTVNDNVQLQEMFRKIIDRLVMKFTLKGMCGIDAIMDAEGELRVLEINPRPTATFELHEHNASLFASHVQACISELPEVLPLTEHQARGHRIVYADKSYTLPEFIWPAWATDRPAAGRLITAGDPVCTVQAEADTSEYVLQLLNARAEQIENLLGQHRRAA